MAQQTPVPLPAVGRSSLSDRAMTALVEAIRQGAFNDGRLPNEAELASQLGVSRATVRSALTSLEQLGLVRRRPGAGTWLRPQVTPDVLALHGLIPWAVLLGAAHHVTSKATLGAADAGALTRLEQATGQAVGRAHRVQRTLSADGRAAVLITELMPDSVLARPLTGDDLADSVLTLSRRFFRVPIAHTVAALVPTAADARTSRLFGVARADPLLMLEETFHSDADEPLATAAVLLNPAFVRLGVFRRVLV
jgi:GntR family transcriptional regulator